MQQSLCFHHHRCSRLVNRCSLFCAWPVSLGFQILAAKSFQHEVPSVIKLATASRVLLYGRRAAATMAPSALSATCACRVSDGGARKRMPQHGLPLKSHIEELLDMMQQLKLSWASCASAAASAASAAAASDAACSAPRIEGCIPVFSRKGEFRCIRLQLKSSTACLALHELCCHNLLCCLFCPFNIICWFLLPIFLSKFMHSGSKHSSCTDSMWSFACSSQQQWLQQ